ncbi:unnamed protein product [Ambrosiozyma monospora]|uniref:Unnamed protein product n=1 Tax=Ambrosiozyma monospora TaxID=43982 RepID=A0ACB5U5A0_AMBMO|nr:unnamed protein product [Ambrosiozyma monospora]
MERNWMATIADENPNEREAVAASIPSSEPMALLINGFLENLKFQTKKAIARTPLKTKHAMTAAAFQEYCPTPNEMANKTRTIDEIMKKLPKRSNFLNFCKNVPSGVLGLKLMMKIGTITPPKHKLI